MTDEGLVDSVHLSPAHTMSKPEQDAIRLIAGHGVEGDAHAGATVQHRSRAAQDPSQPNLRQVHLIHLELIEALRAAGFHVAPGVMGENITTRDLALLDLPRGARLLIGDSAVIEVTGLRNPCTQLEDLQPGLMAAVLDRDDQGRLIRKAGVMSVVIADGWVRPGDVIRVELPAPPHEPLDRV